MRFIHKKVLGILISAFCILCLLSPTAFARSVAIRGNDGSGEAARMAKLLKDWAELRPKWSGGSRYEIEPSMTSEAQPGRLNYQYLRDAFNMANMYRRASGLLDFTYDTSRMVEGQRGAHFLVFNDYVGERAMDVHIDIGDAIFSEGIKQFMTSDITDVGRFFDPRAGMLELGHVKNAAFISPNYAVNYTGERFEAVAVPGPIAYPRELMLAETPWRFYYNQDELKDPAVSSLQITLRHESGRTWYINSRTAGQSVRDTSKPYIHVENCVCGVPGHVAFRPDALYGYDGVFTVTIAGMQYLNGEPADIQYSVRMFSLDNKPLSAPALLDDYGIIQADALIDAAFRALQNKRTAEIHIKGASHISMQTVRQLASQLAAADKDCTLRVDTLSANGKTIEGIVYIKPREWAQMSSISDYTDLPLSVKSRSVDAGAFQSDLRDRFDGKTALLQIACDSMPSRTKIRAYVNLSGMNAQKLEFYYYEPKTKKLEHIRDANYSVDKQGFVSLHLSKGGTIVIADDIAK